MRATASSSRHDTNSDPNTVRTTTGTKKIITPLSPPAILESPASGNPMTPRFDTCPPPGSSSISLSQPSIVEEHNSRNCQKESLLHFGTRPPERPPDQRWRRWTRPLLRGWQHIRENLRRPARAFRRASARAGRKECATCRPAPDRYSSDTRILPVRIKTVDGKKFVSATAFVDSGSEISYLAPRFAREILGIKDHDIARLDDGECHANLDGTLNSMKFKGRIIPALTWSGDSGDAKVKMHRDVFYVSQNPIVPTSEMIDDRDIQIVLGHPTYLKAYRFCRTGPTFIGGLRRAKMPEGMAGSDREQLDQRRESEKNEDAEYVARNKDRIYQASRETGQQQPQQQPQTQPQRQDGARQQ